MRRFFQRVSRHPSAALLFLQLASLLIYPLLIDSGAVGALLTVVGTLAVLLAVRIVNRSPAVNWVSWALAIPAIGLTLAANQFGHAELDPWSHILEALLYFYTAYALIAYMLNDRHVTSDELYAVGATFTLLAWAFAYTFMSCQYWWPNSFTAAINSDDPRSWMEMLFFSFSVLSSVGLSDIVPVTAQARALVMLEMFTGVMYLALVVSRLVGLTAARERET
jgi:Ion channel